MNEQWRPVVGYEGWYEISDIGGVKRVKPGRRTHVGKILSACAGKSGYKRVILSKNGEKNMFLVHHLVTNAFIGPCPDGMQRNHIDGNSMNNRLENLEYVTPSENTLHAYRTGLAVAPHGEANGASKLTEVAVHKIRRLLEEESQQAIADKFGVARRTINDIARGVTWFHLKEEEEEE